MQKQTLIRLLREGKSLRQIAEETSKGASTIRYWVKKHHLSLTPYQCRPKIHCCRFCDEKDESKFVNRGNGRKCKSVCKSCHSDYALDRVRETKKQAVEHKGGKCKKCGYDKCIGALEFHHPKPNEKDPSWNLMRAWKFDRIIKEIDKCELLCANCHREEHYL